jgi:hypothetical protein
MMEGLHKIPPVFAKCVDKGFKQGDISQTIPTLAVTFAENANKGILVSIPIMHSIVWSSWGAHKGDDSKSFANILDPEIPGAPFWVKAYNF